MKGTKTSLRKHAQAQQSHYETIHDEYELHYYDKWSLEFRNQFVYNVIFSNINLNGKTVADLASGSGHNSLALLKRFPQASVNGFDISRKACEAYKTNVGSEAYQLDLTSKIDFDRKFDAAMIFGGLHHCIGDLQGALVTVFNLLKPGGIFLMWEPNRECFLEGARRIWYQRDNYFQADSECALSAGEILKLAPPQFKQFALYYMGGPAYFLICNSMIFRIPQFFKGTLAKPLFLTEKIYNRLPGSFWFPYFIAKWVVKT